MEHPDQETETVSEPTLRFYKPDEPLSPAAEEALNRRTLDEHQEAIDRALRRR